MNNVKACTSKKCRRLGKLLPLSEFHKDSRKMFGVRSQCKECTAIMKKVARDKSPKMLRNIDLSDYHLPMSSKSQREIFNKSSRIIMGGCSYA